MLKLPPQAAYAFRALAVLARDGGGRHRTRDLAAATGSPACFLGKVLARLHQAGLLDAQRGRGGGYRLAGSARTLPLAQVLTLLEGKDWQDECLLGLGPCVGRADCPAQACCAGVRSLVFERLNELTVADLAGLPGG